jgi:hypothetical protein
MYYNKGIVLNADAVEYDNKTQIVSVKLRKNDADAWDSPTGNLDGGHTNRVILDLIDGGWKNPAELKHKQFVTVEILTGIDPEKLSSLVGARNTNIPVKDLSLAVLGNELDWLLDIFQKAGVKNKIAWRQFDDTAEVPGEEVLAYLSLLNPQVTEKTKCYYGSGRIVSDLKLRPEHKGRNKVMDGLKTTSDVAVEFMKFVDYIHKQMRCWYDRSKAEIGENAKFGNLVGIGGGRTTPLIFINETIDYRAAKSWLMPISNSFTTVIEMERKKPKLWCDVAEEVGPALMQTIVSMTQDQKHNLNAVGKSKPVWDTLKALVEANYWRAKAKSK